MDLKKTSERLKKIVHFINEEEINLGEELDISESLYDFKKRKQVQLVEELDQIIKNLRQDPNILDAGINKKITILIDGLKTGYKRRDLKSMEQYIEQLYQLTRAVPTPKKEVNFQIKKLPVEIAEEINADIKEIQKCYNAECYRSVIILCARVLEVSIHRKYFETTGVDLLEKSPGIGLGRLVKKLKEKDIRMDPGISQQIHLINNIRIHAVHKQEKIFHPTQSQAQAVMLYTKDVVEKMF